MIFPVFRLFESVARSCMVVKAAAAQQQSVEGELQECNWGHYAKKKLLEKKKKKKRKWEKYKFYSKMIDISWGKRTQLNDTLYGNA